MTKVKITKEEAGKLMKIEGRTRGFVFNTCPEYILANKGEEGLVKVEKRLKELGCNLNLRKISTFKWLPMSYAALLCIIVAEVFDSDESIVFDLGYNAPINSFIAKSMLQGFIGLEAAFKNTNKAWLHYSTIGTLNTVKYDISKKYAILQFKGLAKLHPIIYDYFSGYFVRLFEIATKSKNVKVKQIKSIFNNDSCDEFKLSW